MSEIRSQATPAIESSAERNARVREDGANAQSLAANIVGTCECHCHRADKHCETCCQYMLCAVCIYYSIGG